MIGKRAFNVRIAALTVGAAIVASCVMHAQTRQRGPWWPNPTWGPDDQSGASNWIVPEKIVQSLRLVKTGKVYELGHVYEREMRGLSNQRTYNLFLVGPFLTSGESRFVYNDEFVSGALGQIGTQFDGLGHAAMRMKMPDGTEQDVYYNGFTGAEISSAQGLRKLGIEHVKPIITRGVLVDVAGYKGVDTLPDGYEVTVADVRGALEREGIAEASLANGDAIFFRYGLARYWNDRSPTAGGRAGVGLAVARWVVDRKPSMVGSDSAGLEIAAGGNVVHQELIMKNGIFNHENLTLDELAADRAYEFLYIFTPLRLKGATGSPGRPIAIR